MTIMQWPEAPLKLVTLDQMGPLQAPSWLVQPLFETHSLVLMFGPANHGKTFVALSMALSVASGLDWAGHSVQQGRVIYVVGEGGRGIQKRGYAWKQHYGHSAPQCHFVQHPVQVVNEPERAKFVTAVRPLAPKLIVLDTLATMTVGVDENDTGDMGRFTAACREIANDLGATVLVIHHPTKSNAKTYRGSYQLEGNFDALIRVERNGNGDIELHSVKQKDEEKFTDFTVGLQSVTLRERDGARDAITSLVVTEAFEVDASDPLSGLSKNERLTLDAAEGLKTLTFTTEDIIAPSRQSGEKAPSLA